MTDLAFIQNPADLAKAYLRFTQTSVFLTGKAGTGKTTLLKYIKENPIKNTAVVAPTGVAAMNAGGTTLHAFFQLPFAPFIPVDGAFNTQLQANTRQSLVHKLRINSERKTILQKLELLIIDEISMVRSDVLDAVDSILRNVRNAPALPFGGVQVLFIGDLHQLPPVVQEEEWKTLSLYYKSPFFFHSRAIQDTPPVYIELNTIYRQTDLSFVDILNKVRNNEMDENAFALLNSRYQSNFIPPKEENYIILTTHNSKAETINAEKLRALTTKSYLFTAAVEGEFSNKAFPAEMELQLKVGAQVMFLKNDIEKPRRFYNGKIGIIEKIETDKILVRTKDDVDSIEVKKEKWRNIRYVNDKTTNKIEEEEIGAFTQFPLRLAWAITIHKSQGLTFEKAIIDAAASFAPGQVYVALSRCTTLEGMVLKSKIGQKSLHNDERIIDYSKSAQQIKPANAVLMDCIGAHQSTTIFSVFNFSPAFDVANDLLAFAETNGSSFVQHPKNEIEHWLALIGNIKLVAEKFQPQLKALLQQTVIPQQNDALQTRIKAAVVHFVPLLENIIETIQLCKVISDSRDIAQAFNKLGIALLHQLHYCLFQLKSCANGYHQEYLLEERQKFQYPSFPFNVYSRKSKSLINDHPHPELYTALKQIRDEICDEKNLPLYLVANSQALDEMARYLPKDENELLEIAGFGPKKTQQYGPKFLPAILAYCEQHQLVSAVEGKTISKKEKKSSSTKADKTPSMEISFALLQEGNTISEIAELRKLTTGTIITHLLHYVREGKIASKDLLDPATIEAIQKAIDIHGMDGTKQIKENIAEEITYDEIRIVFAEKRYLSNQLITDIKN
ncbi:MAG: helix-turn-helix domain-containing protein [Ferruginibacter sp.]